ncbi:hypothetical protein KSB_36770 [Ktedonobacter robiniae]|uniref:Uncharacterized protein n=1 Tax=Ktedonobacter robiniae TaxID=2778365 RepID=A0ABQ3URH2_9CHLR|nr:hypothetical protein KSB_36770 [Ktedonobacter robiniae]
MSLSGRLMTFRILEEIAWKTLDNGPAIMYYSHRAKSMAAYLPRKHQKSGAFV